MSLSILWLLNKKAARVEVNILLAFLQWIGIAHRWPFFLAIFVLKRDVKLTKVQNICFWISPRRIVTDFDLIILSSASNTNWFLKDGMSLRFIARIMLFRGTDNPKNVPSPWWNWTPSCTWFFEPTWLSLNGISFLSCFYRAHEHHKLTRIDYPRYAICSSSPHLMQCMWCNLIIIVRIIIIRYAFLCCHEVVTSEAVNFRMRNTITLSWLRWRRWRMQRWINTAGLRRTWDCVTSSRPMPTLWWQSLRSMPSERFDVLKLLHCVSKKRHCFDSL